MKVVKCEMTFEDKTFTNAQGEVIDYTDISVRIGGEKIRLNVKKEDKLLLKYLLKAVPEVK